MIISGSLVFSEEHGIGAVYTTEESSIYEEKLVLYVKFYRNKKYDFIWIEEHEVELIEPLFNREQFMPGDQIFIIFEEKNIFDTVSKIDLPTKTLLTEKGEKYKFEDCLILKKVFSNFIR